MAMDCSSRHTGWPLSPTRASPCPLFKESLIAFNLSRLWRWTAAPGLPRVAPLNLTGQSLPSPSIYRISNRRQSAPRTPHPFLRNEFHYPLTPLLVYPHLLHRSPNAISYPWAVLEMRRILHRQHRHTRIIGLVVHLPDLP